MLQQNTVNIGWGQHRLETQYCNCYRRWCDNLGVWWRVADPGDSGADEVGAEAHLQRVPVGGPAAASGRHHRQSAQLLQVSIPA